MTRKIPALPIRDDATSSPSGEDLLRILDSLDAAVYVSDIHTHDLLFLNAYGRQQWGEPEGRKCWEVLQEGQSGPCEFCNNPRLLDAQGRPGPAVVWEFQNTQDGRWYQCRDQAILWSDGRLVRVEIATDITERKALEDALKASHHRVERLAYRDELTQLLNRRAFFAACHEQLARLPPKQPFAVMLIDLDHFKAINDAHGHAAGDHVLREVARIFQAQLRGSDILCRFGGEEFALALPGTSRSDAAELAERLRLALSSGSMEYAGQRLGGSASFGVAAAPCDEVGLDELLNAADQAMYRAKHQGRDRVCTALGPG
ncbi:GGDEF domain-containing protein [Halomonas sp. ATCH28]|uniref:diguanylate cyclase n=1 Tax=Halomonas gemina TaxID=2945105 RepID=A0ABT0T1Z2_9GAMM|nr:GGDEF domain-containing protein [Halomonas gemina]MCL7940933.1 GGDEF domain-containing protein [Halomonas gemina]